MSESFDRPNIKQGRWTKEERALFVFAFDWHGKDWKKLSEIITTRSIIQIRSHAQKYCKKFKKELNSEAQAPKVYCLDFAMEDLYAYVSSISAKSYKNYMENQQNLMYAQNPQADYDVKLIETLSKVELNHN